LIRFTGCAGGSHPGSDGALRGEQDQGEKDADGEDDCAAAVKPTVYALEKTQTTQKGEQRPECSLQRLGCDQHPSDRASPSRAASKRCCPWPAG
jgi:hypothetical protein